MLHEKIDVILEQYGILKVTKEQYETLDKEAFERFGSHYHFISK